MTDCDFVYVVCRRVYLSEKITSLDLEPTIRLVYDFNIYHVSVDYQMHYIGQV